MTIGIIFAMKEEIEKFLKKIACEKTQTIYNLTFYKGTYKKLKLVIVESGIGKVNAARSTQILIDNYNPNWHWHRWGRIKKPKNSRPRCQ